MDGFMSLISWAVRAVFLVFDSVLAGLIDLAYTLFMAISDVNLFNDSVIKMFNTRVYVILGIFMLFKVSISIINYVINPENFVGKEKSVTKVFTSVFVTLVMLVITPFIFEYAFKLQTTILKDNIIGQIILGSDASNSSIQNNGGKYMAFSIYKTFVYPAPAIDECADSYGPTGVSDECVKALDDLGEKTEAGDKSNLGKLFQDAVASQNAKALLDSEILLVRKDNQFVFEYMILIPTLCAGFCAWILLIFCIDITVRAVKLGFFQLIAPIPIISYIDPKSGGKDGIFGKWMKQTISIYLDIFIRLLVIYFVIFIVGLVSQNQILSFETGGKFDTGNPILNNTVMVFIIIGCLMFAWKLPKIIKDITGLDMGGFTLNPIKKIAGDNPLAAATLATAGGAAAGGLSNAIKAGFDAKDHLKAGKFKLGDFTNLFTSTAGGMIGGGYRAGKQAYSSKKVASSISSGVESSNKARDTYDKYNKGKYTAEDRLIDALKGFAGVDTKAKFMGIEQGTAVSRLTIAREELARTMYADTTVDYDTKQDYEGITQKISGRYFTALGKEIAVAAGHENYVKTVIEYNQLGKDIGSATKLQAMYQKEDAKKQKGDKG